MLTQTLIDHHASLAGPTFTWNRPGERQLGNRPSAAYRRGLRAYLVAAQDGTCAACGRELDSEPQLCHIVARGPRHRGWQPGNIYAGHSWCNYDDRSVGKVLPITRFRYPELVPTSWPKKLKHYPA